MCIFIISVGKLSIDEFILFIYSMPVILCSWHVLGERTERSSSGEHDSSSVWQQSRSGDGIQRSPSGGVYNVCAYYIVDTLLTIAEQKKTTSMLLIIEIFKKMMDIF
jgi:hypothetical protein